MVLRSWGIDLGFVIDIVINGVNEDMMLFWLYVCIIFFYYLFVFKVEGKVFCNFVVNRWVFWNLKKKKRKINKYVEMCKVMGEFISFD